MGNTIKYQIETLKGNEQELRQAVKNFSSSSQQFVSKFSGDLKGFSSKFVSRMAKAADGGAAKKTGDLVKALGEYQGNLAAAIGEMEKMDQEIGQQFLIN